MKKQMRWVTFVALVAACLMISGARADEKATIIRSIVYDGHTDGVYLWINLTTGWVTGNQTGSLNESVVGTFSDMIRGQGKALTLRDYSHDVITVIRADRTWTHMSFSGTPLNSGTWSLAKDGDAGGAGTSSYDGSL
jgi:hypothetical protein